MLPNIRGFQGINIPIYPAGDLRPHRGAADFGKPDASGKAALQLRASPKAELSAGHPADPLEREADYVADQVLGMPSPSNTGPEPARSAATDGDRDAVSHGWTGGQPLAPQIRQFFEPRFGRSFANVHLHTDRPANDRAADLGSRAFTAGNDIVFGPGEYRPESREGKQLLAHELAHVVQQSDAPLKTRPHSLAASLSKVPSHRPQHKLKATGSTADFVSMVNTILEVQFAIEVSSAGDVSLRPTGVQGPPTRDADELRKTLQTVIGDAKTTTIDFVHGATSSRATDKNVIVGNYELSRVDLDDVAAFGYQSSHSRMGDNAAVQLIHEITEQYRKQVHGEAFATAHKEGYAAQERLLGATLVKETPMTPVGGDEGEVTTTYRYPDKREVDVITRMNFKTGQIVSVKRVVR